jgi:GAF domain-containing protein
LVPGSDIEAIVAGVDRMALGAMSELEARGVRVPYDVAVTGFDGVDEGYIASSPLTTVAMPTYDMAVQAVEMLLALLEGQSFVSHRTVPGKLIVRQSCGCLSTEVALAGEQGLDGMSRDQAISEMVRQADGCAIDDKAAACLVDTFLSEVHGTEQEGRARSGHFLAALDQMLRDVAAAGGDVGRCQDVLSSMRSYLLPSLSGPARPQAEMLWQQGRVLVSESVQRARAAYALQAERQSAMGRQVAQMLSEALDLSLLTDTLVRELPRLGIPRGYLVLYEQPKAPAESARLALACDGGESTRSATSDQPFRAPLLVPDDVLRAGDRYTMMVEPLYFQSSQLGLAVLEVGPRDGTIYELLRAQLSSTLNSIRLLDEQERLLTDLERRGVQLRLQAEELDERVKALDCLNDIGRKTEQGLEIPDFLAWASERISVAMQYPEVCQVAIDFEGQTYGTVEAKALACQIVQGLRIGGNLLGQVYIAYTEEHPFLDAESAMLGEVARRIGGYIEGRRLLEETRSNAAESAVLFELGKALSAQLEMEQVLDEVHAGVSRLLDATNFYIGIYDPGRHQVTFPLNVTRSVVDKGIEVISADEGLTGYVMRTGKSLLIGEDVEAWLASHGIATLGEPAQCWLGVPLLIGDEVQGVMAVQSYAMAHAYTEADQARLEAIASQAAVAVQNARLFERIEARARREQVLREITARVRGSVDPDAILQTAVRELGTALGRRTFVRLGNTDQLIAQPAWRTQPEGDE